MLYYYVIKDSFEFISKKNPDVAYFEKKIKLTQSALM